MKGGWRIQNNDDDEEDDGNDDDNNDDAERRKDKDNVGVYTKEQENRSYQDVMSCEPRNQKQMTRSRSWYKKKTFLHCFGRLN